MKRSIISLGIILWLSTNVLADEISYTAIFSESDFVFDTITVNDTTYNIIYHPECDIYGDTISSPQLLACHFNLIIPV